MNLWSSIRALGGSVAWGVRVALVRLRFIALMVLVAGVVASWDTLLARLEHLTRPPGAARGGAAHDAAEHEYYCPMHPNVIRAEPASCPICGMPLSRRVKGAPVELPPGVLARVELSPNRVRLAGVATTAVVRRPLEQVLDTVGTIEVDERRLARIAARVRGRVEELFVDFTGVEVRAGEPLARLYSQDLFTSSRELLLARAQGGPLFAAARQRLLLWGLDEQQLEAMLAAGEPAVHVTVPSPISGTVIAREVVAGDYVDEGSAMLTVADLSVLWMVARVFEDEAPLVRLGQPVQIRASSYPGRVFEGFVSFVDPRVDPRTRTVGVRVDVPNPAKLLRPGMYVRASLRAPLGPSGELTGGPAALVYRCCAACDVEADAPGDCPQCGMPLTPVETPAEAGAGGYACRCPMHPDEVFRAPGPGLCGLCGAALVPEPASPGEGAPASREPAAPSEPATITLYECPGHPEMTVDHPAICTKCGTMEMIPREAPAAEARRILAEAAAARGEPGAAAPASEAHVHGEPPATRTIYECPMHPEATQDEPGLCEACGGMELIPREVPLDDDPRHPLVLPVDAVIDTGTRRVVYRETEPGVYDAVEVVVGRRVGDFYPVLSGVRLGERVVSRGAFLVDAEARLSPAATANYFGASGGPSGAPGHEGHAPAGAGR